MFAKLLNRNFELLTENSVEKEKFIVNSKELGVKRNYSIDFEGIATFIENTYKNTDSTEAPES